MRKAAILGDGPEADSLDRQASAYFEREGIGDIDGFARVLAPADMTKLGS